MTEDKGCDLRSGPFKLHLWRYVHPIKQYLTEYTVLKLSFVLPSLIKDVTKMSLTINTSSSLSTQQITQAQAPPHPPRPEVFGQRTGGSPGEGLVSALPEAAQALGLSEEETASLTQSIQEAIRVRLNAAKLHWTRRVITVLSKPNLPIQRRRQGFVSSVVCMLWMLRPRKACRLGSPFSCCKCIDEPGQNEVYGRGLASALFWF